MTNEKRAIDHVNLTVPNLEEAVKYYTEVMGFDFCEKFENDGMEFVFLHDGTVVYELIENKNLEKAKLDHIAYVSKDINAEYEHFKSIDESLVLGEVGFAKGLFENGMYYFFIKGACGERVEFCQKK